MTIYGFCNIALIPLRAQPSHRAEMTSQLLFGEIYEIIAQEDNWVSIRSLFDNYEGYIDRGQISLVRDKEIETFYIEQNPVTTSSTTLIYDKRRNFNFYVPPGSSLPLKDSHTIYIGNEWFEIKTIPSTKSMEEIIFSFINSPYLWGGRSPLGIDCSGFNQVVFKIAGLKLKRDASQQVQQGMLIHSIKDAQCYDLAFFENNEGRIIHTGIIYKDQYIIHSSGKVRKDRIDENGIFNLEKEEYSHKLHSIKRIM